MAEPADIAVAFASLLRGGGLVVPLGSVLTFTEALGAVGLEDRNGVYWAGRATLVRKPEDITTYDQVFAAFWLGRERQTVPAPDVEQITLAVDDEDEADGTGDDVAGVGGPTITVRYSPHEVLRHKDFAAY